VPEIVEEMKAIASASDVPFIDIVTLNVRSETSLTNYSDGCTTVGQYWKAKEGSADSVFLAQNWDWVGETAKATVFFDIQPKGGPRIRVYGEAGLVGKFGFNSDGVAVCMNAIHGATSFFLCLSMVSSNTLGTTMKTTVNAIVFVTLAVSYLVGPQIFINPPYYTEAKIATLTLWAIGFLTMNAIWYVNRRENAKRDEAEAAGLIPTVDNVAFLDLTDKEKKKFRYVL